MKSLLLIFCFFYLSQVRAQTLITPSLNIINQNHIPENEIEDQNLKTLKTLKINTTGYSPTLINEMKDEFFAWKEKVVSVTFNTNDHEFILVHNQLMDQRELLEVLRKYGITKTAMTSYK